MTKVYQKRGYSSTGRSDNIRQKWTNKNRRNPADTNGLRHFLIGDFLERCRILHAIHPGERLNGIQEVSGSIPLISTRGKQKEACFRKKASLSHFNHTRHRIDISRNANQVPPQGVPSGTPFFTPGNASHRETHFFSPTNGKLLKYLVVNIHDKYIFLIKCKSTDNFPSVEINRTAMGRAVVNRIYHKDVICN